MDDARAARFAEIAVYHFSGDCGTARRGSENETENDGGWEEIWRWGKGKGKGEEGNSYACKGRKKERQTSINTSSPDSAAETAGRWPNKQKRRRFGVYIP